MDHTTLYITVFYFLTYRLAILLLGAASIFLGYRLFIKGFDQSVGSGAEMGAQVGKLNLTLKNAAPGIFFAAFGTIITTVILMGSQPQLNYSDKGIAAKGNETAPQKTLTVRGRDVEALHDQIWEESYPALLKKAQDVVTSAPDNPDFHDTLASIYFLGNEYAKAAEAEAMAIEKAKAAKVREAGVAALQKKLDAYQRFVQ